MFESNERAYSCQEKNWLTLILSVAGETDCEEVPAMALMNGCSELAKDGCGA
jgi:hypothetical protein